MCKRLMLHYAFAMLVLSMVLRVLSPNERAMRAYLHAGFREAESLREPQRVGQRALDVVYLDCLAREFCAAETRAR